MLINRNESIARLRELKGDSTGLVASVFDTCIQAVGEMDTVEVVHGRWIVLAEFLDRTICTQCSVCGEEYTYKYGKLDFINAEYARYNFCPNCGAKMDVERKNND